MNRIALAVAVGLFLAGCARSGSSPGADAAKATTGESIGYYEIAHGRSVYVLGSMRSVDQLRAGKTPSKLVRRFDSQGREIFIEDDGLVLVKRLTAEYTRRHGSTQ